MPKSFAPTHPSMGRTEDYTTYSKFDFAKKYEQDDFLCPRENTISSGNNFGSSKRDMVNYKVLQGHQYEIVDNPDKKSCVNKRLYICKYDNCNKIFTKTWNLVSHFRVHTNEKPYRCPECKKLFTQRSNLSRHMSIHCKGSSKDKIMNKCPECPRKYSSKYNLNVSTPKIRIMRKIICSSQHFVFETGEFDTTLF